MTNIQKDEDLDWADFVKRPEETDLQYIKRIRDVYNLAKAVINNA